MAQGEGAKMTLEPELKFDDTVRFISGRVVWQVRAVLEVRDAVWLLIRSNESGRVVSVPVSRVRKVYL